MTGNTDQPDVRKAGQAARNVPDDPGRGQRIRARMAEFGLREADVASACDVTSSAVQKWKKGDPIRIKNVAALADVLELEPQVLLGEHYQHYERRAAGAMRPFEEVAARIQEVRGDDPDVSLTSLREEVMAELRLLREQVTDLQRVVAELASHPPGLRTSARKTPPERGP